MGVAERVYSNLMEKWYRVPGNAEISPGSCPIDETPILNYPNFSQCPACHLYYTPGVVNQQTLREEASSNLSVLEGKLQKIPLDMRRGADRILELASKAGLR